MQLPSPKFPTLLRFLRIFPVAHTCNPQCVTTCSTHPAVLPDLRTSQLIQL